MQFGPAVALKLSNKLEPIRGKGLGFRVEGLGA